MVAAMPHQLALSLVPRVDSTAVIIPFVPARRRDDDELRALLVRINHLDHFHALQDRRWRVEYLPPGEQCGKYVVYHNGVRRKSVQIQRPPRGKKKCKKVKKKKIPDDATKKALQEAQVRLALYLMSNVIDWRWLKRVEVERKYWAVVKVKKKIYRRQWRTG